MAAVERKDKNESAKAAQSTSYSVSQGFRSFLSTQKISFAFTSYQANFLYLVGAPSDKGLTLDQRFFRRPMGLAVSGENRFWMSGVAHIIRFDNVLDRGRLIDESFDACFAPRVLHTTGDLRTHDVGILSNGEPIFVNTLFNCLATLSETRSFTPVWIPPFIDKVVPEDRCHLNGLAMKDGRPAYVTAASLSNTIDGWRDRTNGGGVVIDVKTGDIVCTGLSMPHSPRIHNDVLWVLNSGTGELGCVNVKDRKFEPVAFCPGFARGLAFHGKYAFVGLSKPRYNRFKGLPLDGALQSADSDPWCGVQIIDISTGVCEHWFRIDGAVEELYDVAILSGTASPKALGFRNSDLSEHLTPGELSTLNFGP